jgi:hypothetical protein
VEAALTIKIVRVGKDEAPNTVDRLAVHMSECGLYAWSGAIASDARAIFGHSDPEFERAHDAERAALTWAINHGVIEVMIESSDTQPNP